MSNDRLKSLLRQKKLLEEHLEWIEQEIQRASPSSDPSRTPEPGDIRNRIEAAEPKPTPSPTELSEPDQTKAIPDIYESLGPDTKDSVRSARLGCIAMFVGGFLVLGGLVALIYYIY